MKAVIVSRPSSSSRALARNLRIPRIQVGKRRLPRASIVINWGCSEIPGIFDDTWIVNDPEAVHNAIDKKETFKILSNCGLPTVEFTDDPKVAKRWLQEGSTVFGRELTKGSGGRGIHLFLARNGVVDLPKLPLYTRFFKCEKEVRIHVVSGEVIDFAEKRQIKLDKPLETRFWIRTHANGWIYAREDAQISDKVKTLAITAIDKLELDFGAVDVRIGPKDTPAILEINSAPGLVGTTLVNYTKAFWKLINN